MTRRFQVVAVVLLVFSRIASAQQNAFVGVWKLNLSKSTYGAGQAPKSQTRTVEAQGNGAKFTFEGIVADGSKISYSYTTNFDGKDSKISGTGQPNGAEAIAITRIDTNTTTTIMTKAGKQAATTKSEVSKDGKTTTVTSKGVDANGKPRNVVSVYDKQ